MARPGKVVSLVRKKIELNHIPEPDDSWVQIEDFLGHQIPQNLKKSHKGVVKFQMLDRYQIGEIIHEKPPFMNTYKAVVLTGGDNLRVLTSSLITEKDCDGYFPEHVMVPFLQFCKSMTLAGEIISAFATYGQEVVPIPSKTEGIKATGNTIISPPAILLSDAELVDDKGAFCFTRNSVWYLGSQVAQIERIVYNLVPRKMVFRA
jgi:hypothetical protein